MKNTPDSLPSDVYLAVRGCTPRGFIVFEFVKGDPKTDDGQSTKPIDELETITRIPDMQNSDKFVYGKWQIGKDEHAREATGWVNKKEKELLNEAGEFKDEYKDKVNTSDS